MSHAAIGLVGKLPASADFVRRAADSAGFAALYGWLLDGVQGGAAARGDWLGQVSPGAVQAMCFRAPGNGAVLAGGSLGLLANYGLFLAIGEGWPVVPTTFALVVVGFFGGMWLADRLGEERGYRLLGIAAGVLLAAAVTLVLAVLLTTS